MPAQPVLLTLLALAACGTTAHQGHPDCDQYIDCVGVASPAILDDVIAGFGRDGSCWSNRSTEACAASCAAGLSQVSTLDLPECRSEAAQSDCEVIETATDFCSPSEETGVLDFIRAEGCPSSEVQAECLADAIESCDDLFADLLFCNTLAD